MKRFAFSLSRDPVVGWLFNVPATFLCISGTDLLRPFTCCHTETEVADQTVYFAHSQYTGTGPTSPSADPITPGAWQGSHWRNNFEVTGMTRPGRIPSQAGIEHGSSVLEADALTTRPTRRYTEVSCPS